MDILGWFLRPGRIGLNSIRRAGFGSWIGLDVSMSITDVFCWGMMEMIGSESPK